MCLVEVQALHGSTRVLTYEQFLAQTGQTPAKPPVAANPPASSAKCGNGPRKTARTTLVLALDSGLTCTWDTQHLTVDRSQLKTSPNALPTGQLTFIPDAGTGGTQHVVQVASVSSVTWNGNIAPKANFPAILPLVLAALKTQ